MATAPVQTLGLPAAPLGPENSPPSSPTPVAPTDKSDDVGCAGPQGPTLGNPLRSEPAPSGLCGNPINSATGNKIEAETDFLGDAHVGLEFVRYYNSQDTAVTSLGARWRTTWHRSLIVSGNTIAVVRADGHQDVFTLKGGSYVSDPDVTSTLQVLKLGVQVVGYQVTTASDAIETYTTDGKFTSLTTRAGLKTTLFYNSTGVLQQVKGPFGHTLNFTIDGNRRISKMTVPDGGVFTYGYDAFGNLISVTHPDGSKRQYVYENKTFPNFLTGIVDEKGVRFATWTYDNQGRAITSQHAGGVELTTVSYGTNTSTVTDANGAAHTYDFTTQFNVVKPVSEAGVPVPSLGGNAFGYDANGFLASLTDYDGNVTAYKHDPRGDETLRVLASGTSLARSVATTWLPTFHLPTKIVDGSRATAFDYDAQGDLKDKTVTYAGKSSTWSYTYNSAGQVLTALDPVGNKTTYGYDAKGDLTGITNALGQTTKITSFDLDGRPLSFTDPNGLVTTLGYNWRGQITLRMEGQEVTRYGYDLVGQLTGLTRPDGSTLTFTYDPAHRLTGVADGLGNRVAYTLDATSNVTKTQVFGPSGGAVRTSRIPPFGQTHICLN